MYIGLHVKYRLFLSDFHEIVITSTDFRKESNFKFRENPAGAEIFHADGQRDTTKLIVAFRHFVNAPSKSNIFSAARYVELRYIMLHYAECEQVSLCATSA